MHIVLQVLTQYDLKVGDGDCGITVRKGAEHAKSRLQEYMSLGRGQGASALLTAVADGVSASMGGTSGALLELMFRAMARSMSNQPDPTDNNVRFYCGRDK